MHLVAREALIAGVPREKQVQVRRDAASICMIAPQHVLPCLESLVRRCLIQVLEHVRGGLSHVVHVHVEFALVRRRDVVTLSVFLHGGLEVGELLLQNAVIDEWACLEVRWRCLRVRVLHRIASKRRLVGPLLPCQKLWACRDLDLLVALVLLGIGASILFCLIRLDQVVIDPPTLLNLHVQLINLEAEWLLGLNWLRDWPAGEVLGVHGLAQGFLRRTLVGYAAVDVRGV